MTILEYVKEDGSSPFSEWINGLDGSVKYRVQARILKLRDGGHFGFHKRISENLYEIKFKTLGGGIRIYYALVEENKRILLLCGGNKSKQGKDIKLAQGYWKDYQSRKAED